MTPRQQSRPSGLWLCLSPLRQVVKTPRWPEERLHLSPSFANAVLLEVVTFSPCGRRIHVEPRMRHLFFLCFFYGGSFAVTLCPRGSAISRLSSVAPSTPARSLFCTPQRSFQRGIEKKHRRSAEECLIKEASVETLRSWAL